MALTPNFSTSQSLSNLDTLSIADTSTGSDGTVTARRVYLRKHDGTYLVPTGVTTDYITWDIGDTDKDIASILDKDYALDVTVNWMNGSSIVYSKNMLQAYKGYALSYSIDLSRFASSNPKLLNNSNYFNSKSKLQTLIDDVDQVVVYNGDQSAAQLFLTMANELISNQSYFF